MKHLLSDRHFRNAKPAEGKEFQRFPDGDGLYLVAWRTGGKSFQFRYTYGGKEQTFTLKGSPSLADARVEADGLRKMIAAGDDPRVMKHIERVSKVAASGQTFELTKDAWVEQQSRRQKWSSDYLKQVQAEFRNHLKRLYPIPIDKIRARITAPILADIERVAPGVVDHVAQRLYAIMDFAVKQGHIEINPLPKHDRVRTESKNFAAITNLVPDPKKDIHTSVGDILRDFDKIGADRANPRRSHSSVRRAHLLLVFTAQRIAEVVNARWKEFDLDAGTWTIPRARMKIKDEKRGEHEIPLPPVLLGQLRAWRAADAKSAIYVCPSARSAKQPLHDTVVGKAYCNDLGLKETHSPHSWRAVFKTVCKEARKEKDLIEAQLDHISGNAVESAYDRAKLVDPRRELLTWYEATIIAARDGAKVLPLKRKSGET